MLEPFFFFFVDGLAGEGDVSAPAVLGGGDERCDVEEEVNREDDDEVADDDDDFVPLLLLIIMPLLGILGLSQLKTGGSVCCENLKTNLG